MSSDPPLDPGVPARKRNSSCTFCLWTCVVLIGLPVGFFLVVFIYGLGKGLFKFTQFSHSRVFQNQTLEEVGNRTSVVRPLVDEKQSFDIAVSIWALPLEENAGESSSVVPETPLYSDIVFRGLHLADKHQTANLTYKLPIAIFQRLLLKENDLRASFVLIPTSPSLVDQIINFSTWRPEVLTIPPFRSWPFPLGAPDNGPQSAADRALDSFGISMPLLEFHEFGSKCTNSTDSDTSSSEDKPGDDQNNENNEDEDEEENHIEEKDDTAGGPLGVSDIAKYPEHALKRHPFVVTRTQIRAVDETHIFNRKLYNKEHNKLRSTSCGQGRDKTPDLNLCHRDYRTNGHWETRFQLQVQDADTGEPLTEWAYAPYLSHARSAAGPQDIVAIPVTRENCTNTSSTDPDFIKIDWRISYSGRSPVKYLLSDSLDRSPSRVSYNESDYKKVMAHNKAEVLNGMAGHRFHADGHPRRRLLIGLLAAILRPISNLLNMEYWFTRTSTVSISVSGTTLLAFNGIFSAFTGAATTVETSKLKFSISKSLSWLWLIIWTLATNFTLPFFMLKIVMRLAFNWDQSRWIPSIRRVSSSHLERASQRLDSRTSWRIKAGVCISLIAINYYSIYYHFFVPFNYHVLAAHHPPPALTDRTAVSHPFARYHLLIYWPLHFTGNLSQLLLNQRSKTFAGRHKIGLALSCIHAVLNLITYLPAVVGRYDARPGLSFSEAVEYIILAAMAWQAAVFPQVTQKMEDEDSE
ncbi:hypothetical protein DFH08DRAFT_425650 [Mycena albidolilacea]|uniref:Uncharacterized protein n=1 Tax=Mycena albidolilacea TaxID=1033008 RepID=A0AAD7EEP5_9AGAR|nr:hypothetical protein DFH08DRAFT_425650 [Mycena albidolilacea]